MLNDTQALSCTHSAMRATYLENRILVSGAEVMDEDAAFFPLLSILKQWPEPLFTPTAEKPNLSLEV